MRSRIVPLAVIVGVASWMPLPAGANGGAYIEFDETYYVSGNAASAETYVYVPKAKEGLLDRGPFWLYALPRGVELERGRPAPAAAVPLGALTVREDAKESYELETRFTMPQLSPGEYTIGLCNPGCELTGFGEALSGSFVIAASQREVELLRTNDALEIDVANLEHRLRKSEKTVTELEEQLAGSEEDRVSAAATAGDVQQRLDAAEAQNASLDASLGSTSDSLVRWRLAALILAAFAIVAFAAMMVLFARRRAAGRIPDTPEELIEPAARR